MRAKKTQQPTVSAQYHNEVVNSFTSRIQTLEGQIAQRDKLIGLMCADHQRSYGVTRGNKAQISAVIALVDSFTNTFNSFKRALIENDAAKNEFDATSDKNAREISMILNKIEQEKNGHGALASQMAQTEAKAITRDHTLTN
jgi:hypothetical protein